MVNVYVHLAVIGLPADAIDDDAFVEALCRELPDASVTGGPSHPLGVTLSQFALTDDAAVHHQTARAQRAMAAVGRLNATVQLDEVVRERMRDDIGALVGAVRWSVCRLAGRVPRR